MPVMPDLNPEQWDRFSAVWTVLGRLFASAPSEAELDVIRTAEMLDDWPLPDGDRSAAGLAELAASATAGEDAAAVKDDHFRLVVGPGRARAVPWESVYLSSEGLVFEAETMAVRHFYRRFGLQAPRLNRDPDDHISLELEFCATLLGRAFDALAEGADPQPFVDAHRDFCREHLLRWAPEFFRRVEDGAETRFYTGVGILGQDACAQLVALIGELDES